MRKSASGTPVGKTCLSDVPSLPEVPLENRPDPVNGGRGGVPKVWYDHSARAVRPIVHTLSATATRQSEAP
jgi:hypothetical protein